jgi:hypothetical protein
VIFISQVPVSWNTKTTEGPSVESHNTNETARNICCFIISLAFFVGYRMLENAWNFIIYHAYNVCIIIEASYLYGYKIW